MTALFRSLPEGFTVLPATVPAYEIRKTPLYGARYTKHELYVGGVFVHSQISPYSEAEIESRIMSHLRADPSPASTFLPELVPGARAKGSKGGKAKKAKVNARGFIWDKEEEL